jgi:hypothetical protein
VPAACFVKFARAGGGNAASLCDSTDIVQRAVSLGGAS